MPHQCVHCGKIISSGSKEILEGCSECHGHFFFYVRDDRVEEVIENPIEFTKAEADNIEQDIRDIVGIKQEDIPVILDVESVRVMGDGKFEIDLVNLFDKKRPLVYKLEEGKYVIDVASSLQSLRKDNGKKNWRVLLLFDASRQFAFALLTDFFKRDNVKERGRSAPFVNSDYYFN